MAYENLQIDLTDGILTTVNLVSHEKALNAFNRNDVGTERFFGEAAPAMVRHGRSFAGRTMRACCGADIAEFQGLSPQQGKELAQRGQDVFPHRTLKKPVIAAVNGFALGGGCELAMACHLRVAGEKARFGQPEVNLGLIPGYGGTQRLIQYIGKTKATELLMTADMIGAEEAYRLGLVNYVVPAGEEVLKAKELIEKIATKAPSPLQRLSKR